MAAWSRSDLRRLDASVGKSPVDVRPAAPETVHRHGERC
jgi:hypothetical protein